MRYLLLSLSLISCTAPTAPTSEPPQAYCYTYGPISRLVYGEPCDGLACPMTTANGDTIAVDTHYLTMEASCR
jgi:hypothetical protein